MIPPLLALEWCREVTRAHSHTFYRGSLLYPAGQREAVWAVYAACRIGDDIVDEPAQDVGTAQAQLDEWWAEVQAAFGGQHVHTHMGRALAWAVAKFPLPLHAFAELYEGFCMDLRGVQYHTLADLELYCHRVAGVVGFMIAPIGGYHGGQATLDAALKLGQAMQLTNILRDVGEDLGRGRLYLPSELLQRFGVQETDLRAGRVTPEYVALLRHLIELADYWYAQGMSGIPQLRGRARYGVAVAAQLYHAILAEVVRGEYNNLTRRAVVPGGRKWWLTAWAVHDQWSYVYCPLHWVGRQYARLKASQG